MTRAMTVPLGDGLIPVRMLTQFAYCPRLGYMEWVQGEFQSSADVEEGRFQHRVVDEPSGRRKMAEDEEGGDGGEVIHARSVMLSDERLGLVAKADLLELEGKAATPDIFFDGLDGMRDAIRWMIRNGEMPMVKMFGWLLAA